MIESHLQEGRQDAKPGQELAYGRSITDACLGWDDSEDLIAALAAASGARARRPVNRDTACNRCRHSWY